MEWARLLPGMDAVLAYLADEIAPDREFLEQERNEWDLERILASHKGKTEEISSRLPDEEASDAFQEFLKQIQQEGKKVKVAYYTPSQDYRPTERTLYVIQGEEKAGEDFAYLFVPRGISIHRVPQNVLGDNVLGRTWLGTGYVEILDTLYGDAFQEVLSHELNHLLYPHENEMEIRNRTRRQIKYPLFH